MLRHGVQQLGHHQEGLPGPAAPGGDVLLGSGQVQKPQIAAQVPPGHGDHVAGVHPLGQALPALPVLDLGEYREVLQTPAGQGRPDLLQLMAAADKGLHHRRDPLPGRVVQVQQVLLRQGRAAQLHPRQGDAFPAFQHPAPGDGAGDGPAAGLRPQGHESVIQQNLLPRGHGGQDIRLHRQAPGAQGHGLPRRQGHGTGQGLHPQLRPPHIDDQLRRTAGGRPGLLHRLRPGAAGRQGGVGQVQAEARQPHVQQFRQQVRPAAGGAKGGVGFHGVSSL